MGLYPSQTALVIRCCVHEREQTADLFPDTSDDERKETKKTNGRGGALARSRRGARRFASVAKLKHNPADPVKRGQREKKLTAC